MGTKTSDWASIEITGRSSETSVNYRTNLAAYQPECYLVKSESEDGVAVSSSSCDSRGLYTQTSKTSLWRKVAVKGLHPSLAKMKSVR